MKNGYDIFWTDFAKNDLKNIIDYLENHWTLKELKQFSKKLDKTIFLISQNPFLFQSSINKKDVKEQLLPSITRSIIESTKTQLKF